MASVRINAQISTISPQLHMCQTLCRGKITLRSEARCQSFFLACQSSGMHGEIDHYIRVGGRNLSAPPLAYKFLASTGMNQMVGT